MVLTWQDALRAVWLEHFGRPVVFGALDCCQFVRAYVRHLTGRDFGADFDYTSETEALEIIARHGDLLGLLAAILGPPQPTAEPGDVVVVDMGAAKGAAVWQGDYCIGVHPTRGLTRFRAPIVGAWCPK